jgi:hypothetical protein
MQIAAQARLMIAVLLLKMLRLQEHALPPQNRAKWLHGTSSTADSSLTTSGLWRTASQYCSNVLLIIAHVIVGASAKIHTSLR